MLCHKIFLLIKKIPFSIYSILFYHYLIHLFNLYFREKNDARKYMYIFWYKKCFQKKNKVILSIYDVLKKL